MANEYNKVALTGNVGRDAEVKNFPNGDKVANTSIAQTDKWKKDGADHSKTSWYDLQFPDHFAENASKLVKKGRHILVEGTLEQRDWKKDVNGTSVDMTSFYIRVTYWKLLDAPKDAATE